MGFHVYKLQFVKILSEKPFNAFQLGTFKYLLMYFQVRLYISRKEKNKHLVTKNVKAILLVFMLRDFKTQMHRD